MLEQVRSERERPRFWALWAVFRTLWELQPKGKGRQMIENRFKVVLQLKLGPHRPAESNSTRKRIIGNGIVIPAMPKIEWKLIPHNKTIQ